jgi:glycosyltransferase involved in cell wall biosynthesis
MNLLPEGYELWLVGDGELRLFVENEIKRMGLQKRVHLLGNRIDVPEIIKSSDVVVLSSHWEGFGLAAVEGMAAGKPVIVSDVDGLKQVVEGFGILFPQGDFETLAKEIRHLAEDKDYAANIAKLCQQRAADFDISVMTNNYNKLYQKIIEEG